MKKFICCFLILPISIFSQTTFNLNAALKYAVENNNDFKNSKVDLLIADERIRESISSGLPKINGDLGYQNYIDIPTTVLPANAFNPNAPADQLIGLQFGTSINASGTIRLDQLIFSATYISGLKAAKAYKNLMGIIVEKAKVELLSLTTNAYFSSLIFTENQEILTASLDKLQSIQSETKSLVKEGMIAQINEDQIDLLVLQLENRLSEMELLEKNAVSTLKFIMGYPQDSAITLSDKLSNYLLDEWGLENLNINASESIDYKIQLENVKLNSLNVKMNQATGIPSLSGFFSHQQIALRNEFNLLDSNQPWYPATFWGIRVNVPIFDSREQAAKTNQSKLELEKAKNSLVNVENNHKYEVSQAINEYNINLLAYKNNKENLKLSQKILSNTLIKFKEGVASSTDVAQAQNQELTAQSQFLQTNFNLLISKLKLDKLQNKINLQ
tara:strand:- start:1967 stop:3298 length:1332 start_codon:yes stop_codon:yes gene_type:complete